MDRQSSIDARTRQLRHFALAGELVPALIAILLALQCGIALLLIVRRAQGAITLTSSSGWLILWMLLASLLAAVTRGVWQAHYGHATGAAARAAWYAPLVALLFMALALTTLRMSLFVGVVPWGIVLVLEVLTGLLWRRGGWANAAALVSDRWPGPLLVGRRWTGYWTALRRHSVYDEAPEADRPGIAVPTRSRPDAGRAVFELAAASARFAQRIERVQAVDGRDILAGTLSTRLAAGQVTAHVHVAFCPAFESVPRLDFRQAAGPAARIKLGQVLPHGARIDVKLDAPPAEPVFLELEVRAAKEPEQQAAADEQAEAAGQQSPSRPCDAAAC